MIRRTLIATLFGMLAGGIFSGAVFLLGALLDGTKFTEAFAYSLILAFLAAISGGFIGFIVGLTDSGPLGGGLIGLIVALALVIYAVLDYGGTGGIDYYLGESRILVVMLAVPLILAGISAAFLKNKLAGRSSNR